MIHCLRSFSARPFSSLPLYKRNGQSGEPPATTTFTAGPQWKQYTFLFSTFDTDLSDLTALGFIRLNTSGEFQL